MPEVPEHEFQEKDKETKDMDWSKVQDLYDEDEIMEEIKREGNLVVEVDKPKTPKKTSAKQDRKLKQLEAEEFEKEYKRTGGIQHIICSATLSIDKKGRVTPKQTKIDKKRQLKEKVKKIKGHAAETENSKKDDIQTTFDALAKVLKFRSNQPKMIDLTSEEAMPESLNEQFVRCTALEKDLYLFYYLQSRLNESAIIFCNSI